MKSREDWLNGWPRGEGSMVLIGTGTYCAGCGALTGVACVAIDLEWAKDRLHPEWPFDEAACPVCTDPKYLKNPRLSIEQLAAHSLFELRHALMIVKDKIKKKNKGKK